MHKTFIKKGVSVLLGIAAIMGCERHNADSESLLNGVWEGPMRVTETGTTVKILNVTGSTAEFYDMYYSLSNGYTVKSKKVSDMDFISGNDTHNFAVCLDGKEYTFSSDGASVIYSADGTSQYVSTSNTMDYYKSFIYSPFLVARDKEFVGPSTYSEPLLTAESLTADFNWLEFLEWAGKTAATTAWGKGVSVLLDMLFPPTGETTTLDELLGKMNAITDQLNQMTLLYKNTTYEAKLNERSKYVSELTNYNSEYYVRLGNAKTEEDVSKIITEWASHTVGGNPVYVQGLNFIDFLLNTVIEQRDIFNMYDLYTYNTTAWENEGYAVREALRAGDIAVAAENLYLTQLYYTLRTDLDENSKKIILDNNINKFNIFTEYVKNRPVEHHDDRVICQIAGCHFAMDAVNYDVVLSGTYKNPYWYSIPCKWIEYDSDLDFIYGPNKIENYNKSLTADEARKILDYYSGTELTLSQILRKAGFKFNMATRPEQTLILTLQSGAYSADKEIVGLDNSVYYNAKSSGEVGPKYLGKGYFEVKGNIYTWYLQFVRWTSFDDNQIWIRTKVVER